MEVGITRGKKAVTNYQTLEVFENDRIPALSLVECKLETGRTHQIRVHMNHKGNSILGDKKYKNSFGIILDDVIAGFYVVIILILFMIGKNLLV